MENENSTEDVIQAQYCQYCYYAIVGQDERIACIVSGGKILDEGEPGYMEATKPIGSKCDCDSYKFDEDMRSYIDRELIQG